MMVMLGLKQVGILSRKRVKFGGVCGLGVKQQVFTVLGLSRPEQQGLGQGLCPLPG